VEQSSAGAATVAAPVGPSLPSGLQTVVEGSDEGKAKGWGLLKGGGALGRPAPRSIRFRTCGLALCAPALVFPMRLPFPQRTWLPGPFCDSARSARLGSHCHLPLYSYAARPPEVRRALLRGATVYVFGPRPHAAGAMTRDRNRGCSRDWDKS